MEYGLRHGELIPMLLPNFVLILVVMEYGLRRYTKYADPMHNNVLILVVMEYGLRQVIHRLSV